MAAKIDCRLRLRKEEPVTYYMHTNLTFLNLSRELRDRIYSEALVVLTFITVCSMITREIWPGMIVREPGEQLTHDIEYFVTEPDVKLRALSLGLLRTSKVIAEEAAEVFYRSNVFHFGGTEIWNPLYGWLGEIGSQNRRYLRHISVEMDNSDPLSTARKNIHVLGQANGFRFQRVVSCGQQDEEEFGVYFLDPAIEACFRILGSEGLRLQLRVLVRGPYLPGVHVYSNDFLVENSPWSSLEIPRFVERCRVEFARNVDVLWFDNGKIDIFCKKREEIYDQEWEILETQDRHYDTPNGNYSRTYFVLRRICFYPVESRRGWSIDRLIEHYNSIQWPLPGW